MHMLGLEIRNKGTIQIHGSKHFNPFYSHWDR